MGLSGEWRGWVDRTPPVVLCSFPRGDQTSQPFPPAPERRKLVRLALGGRAPLTLSQRALCTGQRDFMTVFLQQTSPLLLYYSLPKAGDIGARFKCLCRRRRAMKLCPMASRLLSHHLPESRCDTFTLRALPWASWVVTGLHSSSWLRSHSEGATSPALHGGEPCFASASVVTPAPRRSSDFPEKVGASVLRGHRGSHVPTVLTVEEGTGPGAGNTQAMAVRCCLHGHCLHLCGSASCQALPSASQNPVFPGLLLREPC